MLNTVGEMDDEGNLISNFFLSSQSGSLREPSVQSHHRSSRRQLNMNEAGTPSPNFLVPGVTEDKASSDDAAEDGFLKRGRPIGDDDETDEDDKTDEEDSNKTVDLTLLVERSSSLVR